MATAKEIVPDDWKSIGFSGLFSVESALDATPAEAEVFEAKLPTRVPFGTNSGWLALRVNRDVDPPTVILVRRDSDALVEAYTGVAS